MVHHGAHHIMLNYSRDEKVKVLKAIPSLSLSSSVLGQYEADPNSKDPDAKMGYLDDPTVSISIALVAYHQLLVLRFQKAQLLQHSLLLCSRLTMSGGRECLSL